MSWAAAASTTRRIRRGEGALLAVNLSLLLHQPVGCAHACAAGVVSVLTIAAMYAFNDLYDAPADVSNPKKDRALVDVYLRYRSLSAWTIAVLSLLTLGLAGATLDPRAATAVAGALIVNVLYSTRFKGVPVVDVAWCGLWGALYAAIVTATPWLWALFALMTAVCHLFQALDDRAADAANSIVTTAVRSAMLSVVVLLALSVALAVVLREPLGNGWALTACFPLAAYFLGGAPRRGWLLTKLYFGVLWLYLLEVVRAAG